MNYRVGNWYRNKHKKFTDFTYYVKSIDIKVQLDMFQNGKPYLTQNELTHKEMEEFIKNSLTRINPTKLEKALL